MAIGQIAAIGKEINKFYRITMFNGSPSTNRGIHFYSTKKIENINDLKSYISGYGYTYSGSRWKFIDVAGYYSSTHASKIFLTPEDECMLINSDSSQSAISNATYICSEV